ncbi:MAG: ATP-binding protein [Planctomycetota bacterium]|nr:ATP-binding protein [Planctomycetota bacterium]
MQAIPPLDPILVLHEFLTDSPHPVLVVGHSGLVRTSNEAARQAFESNDLAGCTIESLCNAQLNAQQEGVALQCTSTTGRHFLALVTTLAVNSGGEPAFLHMLRCTEGSPRIDGNLEACLIEVARSPTFVAGDFQVAAQLLTRAAGRALGVASCSVWLLEDEGATLRCAQQYELSTDTDSRGATLTAAEYPAYFRALESGRALPTFDARNDPRTSELSEYLETHGVESILDAVIRVSGRMVGVVCYEHQGGQRMWSNDEVTFAAEMADQAAHAYLLAEKRSTQEERDRLSEELQRSQKLEAVGRLAGGVAHDFNNLLSVILGYADLGKISANSETADCLDEIRSATQRAAKLTSQLLSVGRQQVLHAVDIDLNELVRGALDMLGRVLPEGIELSFQAGAPVATVHADAGQLEQVLLNLCINGRDAIEGRGRIAIRTWIEERGGDGSWVKLEVSDDGSGIPQGVLDHIFEPFFTTKAAGEGSGLGLSMVYGIVNQHGGDVTANSELGVGSTFRVRLPLVTSYQANPATPPRPSQANGSGGLHLDTPCRLLLAEDSTEIRVLNHTALVAAGFEVEVAEDGAKALHRFKSDPRAFDLVVLDVIMPELNGPDALVVMRSLRPELPAIFTTGYGSEALSDLALEQDSYQVLHKPHTPRELVALVRRLLSTAPSS